MQEGAWRQRARRDWEESVRAAFQEGYGHDLPEDFEPNLFLAYCQGHPAPDLIPAIVKLLAGRGCPLDSLLLADWAGCFHDPDDLDAFEQIIDLFQPQGEQDWQVLRQLVRAHREDIPLEQIFGLAGELGGHEQGRALAVLGELVGNLPDEAERGACLAALRACRNLGLSVEEVGRVVGRYARDAEAVAALGELASLLSLRASKVPSARAFERLLETFPNRAAAKRYGQVLARLDRTAVKVDPLDDFVVAFARDAIAVEWLDAALSALRRLGRTIDRLALTTLLEWAPDVKSIEHYVRGTLALRACSLPEKDIEAILLPRVGNETAIAVICSLEEISRRLSFGKLTRDQAERLLAMLPGRVEVKRLNQAIALLLALGIGVGDLPALAPEFVASPDDIAWLEALAQQALEFRFKVDRVELLRLRESCPQVAQLYRYCRIRNELMPFKVGREPGVTGIALEAAADPYATISFIKVLTILRQLGRAERVNEGELRRMYLIHRLPDLVRRRSAS